MCLKSNLSSRHDQDSSSIRTKFLKSYSYLIDQESLVSTHQDRISTSRDSYQGIKETLGHVFQDFWRPVCCTQE